VLNVKCQSEFVECINNNNNTSNALNGQMISKKCRLQVSPEGVETVPDTTDTGSEFQVAGAATRMPDGHNCRANNVEWRADGAWQSGDGIEWRSRLNNNTCIVLNLKLQC